MRTTLRTQSVTPVSDSGLWTSGAVKDEVLKEVNSRCSGITGAESNRPFLPVLFDAYRSRDGSCPCGKQIRSCPRGDGEECRNWRLHDSDLLESPYHQYGGRPRASIVETPALNKSKDHRPKGPSRHRCQSRGTESPEQIQVLRCRLCVEGLAVTKVSWESSQSGQTGLLPPGNQTFRIRHVVAARTNAASRGVIGKSLTCPRGSRHIERILVRSPLLAVS